MGTSNRIKEVNTREYNILTRSVFVSFLYSKCITLTAIDPSANPFSQTELMESISP